MSDKEEKILVIGSLNYDIILEQQRLPEKGETYTVDRVTVGSGGKGANQAVQAAKMGVHTKMFGALGNDLYGDHIQTQLTAYGVNTELIKRTTESTGLGINNVLPDGTLYANIVRGANYCLTKQDIDLIDAELATCKLVIFQLEIPSETTEYAISRARQHGCYIVLNAAPAMAISTEALQQVDCLIVNEKEASYYLNRPIKTVEDALCECGNLQKKIRDILVITLGENGSLVYNGTSKILLPSRRVTAVDTTGAGDSYTGVFATQLLAKKELLEAARLATLAASITVTKPGSQQAMPNLRELLALANREKLEPVFY